MGFKDVYFFMQFLENHTDAILVDFRKIYGISALEVGKSIAWGEGMILLLSLSENTESMLFAELHGIKEPWSNQEALLMDFIDIFASANSEKGKNFKYPRPWDAKKDLAKKGVPFNIAKNIFAKLGHKPEITK